MVDEEIENYKKAIVDEVVKRMEEKMSGQPDMESIVKAVKTEILSDNKFKLATNKEEPGAFAKGIKKALAEGTGSAGGYLVPTTYINKIIDIMKIKSLVLQYADIMPVATNQAVVPTLDTNVVFTWTNENAAGTEHDPVFGQLNLQVKKGMAITTIPNELLDDKTIGGAVDAYLVKLFGRAFAKEIDRVALTGDTGAGDPFMGVINTTGITVVAAASATDPAYKELVDVTMGINDDYSVNPIWIAHRTFYAKCLELLDSNNRPILNPEAKTLVAYPYVRNERMPHTFTTGLPIALFGDLGVVRIAMRQNLVIEASKQVNFKSDQTVLRAKFRMGIGVTPADSFVLYKLG